MYAQESEIAALTTVSNRARTTLLNRTRPNARGLAVAASTRWLPCVPRCSRAHTHTGAQPHRRAPSPKRCVVCAQAPHRSRPSSGRTRRLACCVTTLQTRTQHTRTNAHNTNKQQVFERAVSRRVKRETTQTVRRQRTRHVRPRHAPPRTRSNASGAHTTLQALGARDTVNAGARTHTQRGPHPAKQLASTTVEAARRTRSRTRARATR